MEDWTKIEDLTKNEDWTNIFCNEKNIFAKKEFEN